MGGNHATLTVERHFKGQLRDLLLLVFGSFSENPHVFVGEVHQLLGRFNVAVGLAHQPEKQVELRYFNVQGCFGGLEKRAARGCKPVLLITSLLGLNRFKPLILKLDMSSLYRRSASDNRDGLSSSRICWWRYKALQYHQMLTMLFTMHHSKMILAVT